MKIWEHKIIVIVGQRMDTLNEEGKAGWQAYHIEEIAPVKVDETAADANKTYRIWMKRRL